MKKTLLSMVLLSVFATGTVMAAEYEVTITNVTPGTIFTPILVVSHGPGVKLFKLGMPASDELVALAEGGNVDPLATALAEDPRVVGIADSGGLLLPGDSITVTVDAVRRHGRISLASMLLPTNDGFIALNSVKAPQEIGRTLKYISPGYDAGSEINDELCENIPAGGPCPGMVSNGNVPSAGVVHIHSGIHGNGDLVPSDSDWRNPVAYISITRMN
ncbi:MAG: spondin domain-containing protein [Phycisphaeraceae bacterium]|nr:spondin domain-containing protein [Phycisphaeraceae bacterium]